MASRLLSKRQIYRVATYPLWDARCVCGSCWHRDRVSCVAALVFLAVLPPEEPFCARLSTGEVQALNRAAAGKKVERKKVLPEAAQLKKPVPPRKKRGPGANNFRKRI
jgi:hypothetical protein